MVTDRIVGRVCADILQRRIADSRQSDGQLPDSSALFRLDKLSSRQIASVVKAILANPELSTQIDLRIPSALVEGEGLPEFVLTDQNAGAVRNSGTSKVAVLTANGNEDNLADTLGHVTALGAKEFRANEDCWVEATCHVTGIAPAPEDRKIFLAALKGMFSSFDLSLHQIGNFCALVSEANSTQGQPIRESIGWALPAVGLPRDTAFFSSARSFGTAAGPWRKAFDKLFIMRYPLLSRLKPNGQPLEAAEMLLLLEENAASIQDYARVALEAFIHAPAGDDTTAQAIAQLEWEVDGVHFIFDKSREKQKGLADSTIHFFDHDCEDANVLEERWRMHLEKFKTRERRLETNEEDEIFFELHRPYIEKNPKLLARWEKAIFGKPLECHDFLEGFATVAQRLIAGADEPKGDRSLLLTVSKGRTKWREGFNRDVGAYFSVMHRGLKDLMGNKIDWIIERMGSGNLPDPLFDHPAFLAKEKEIRGDKLKPCVSLSKPALQIKFEVALIEHKGTMKETLDKTQLIWSYRPESIGLSLAADMSRLKDKGSVGCTEVPRRLVSKKGGVQSVSLLETSSLEASYSRDAGSLVPPPKRLRSMRSDIKRRIDELEKDGRLSPEQRNEIRAAWNVFEEDYIKALDDFIFYGLHGEAVIKQAESFAALLRTLSEHARGDVCRAQLVAEVLSIGTVRLLGAQPCLIIPPWHPERMKALAVKTRRVASLVTHMLSGKDVRFGDRGIFFREFSEELAHPFYPEIGVVMRGATPHLVAETSTVNGYSLLESPERGSEDQFSDVDPSAAAKQIRELLERYVGLQPHEGANLSVLLYNADAAELPLAAVRELSNLNTEADFQCNVSVRHRDQAKLRRVYAELVNKTGDDPDLPVVSETSDNFMSKLRISVIPPSATPPKSANEFRPFDIAFLHDVVSRTAAVEWVQVDWTNERPTLEHAPSRWSYRSVSGENELKSTTFLTCPRQTSSGWEYVRAVGAVTRLADPPANTRFLPARRITLQDESISGALDEAHALAEWVATYDELLDKRQLQANKVTVVRYRRASTNGRNMIVSSTSELRLLGVLLKRRLDELALPLDTGQTSGLVGRMKKDALSISGDIVLRAAKRGVSAGEMIGLVLSRHLLEKEFKALTRNRQVFTVFFLLDDYADWLSQKESRIADILGLCVEEGEDGPSLHIAIVESKYVSHLGAAEAKRSSKAQLLATLTTFQAALFGDPGRLDRDVWLARLADMLLDADIPPGCTPLLERVRAKLRDGEAGISLRGYSHVFVHSAETGTSQPVSEQIAITDANGRNALQEVFERGELRELICGYADGSDPAQLRSKLGPERPWSSAEVKLPAPRVTWMTKVEQMSPMADTDNDLKTVEVPSNEPAIVESAALIVTATSELVSSSILPAVIKSGHNLSALVLTKMADCSSSVDEREVWAEDTKRKLKTALNGYGLQAAVLGTRLTPNGCLVRLAGSDKLRVEDIEAKRTQLLTTHAINLVTVQPKPGEIVVTIASEKRQSVSMWDLWARRELNRNAAGINTSFILGVQEINGALLYLNLGTEFGGLQSHEPHSLVAGATGSGKSVLIQSLLLDVAATNSKDLAQIILIDPKMGVDYSALEDLPHMREPIITTRTRSTEVLMALVEEMESRYRLFAPARAKDLATFNAKAAPEDRLPMIFLVHDEFADWMLDDVYKGAVSSAVQRLGVKARAAGIHLVFAAQRPDKDVMPMQLRENLGNRLILKVASEATSKIALDRPGAELLLGKGHLAAKLNGEQGLVFAQAPFLSDEEIGEAVAAIKQDADMENIR